MSNLSLTTEQRDLANGLTATGRTERLTAYKQARILTALADTGLSIRDLVTVAKERKVASLGRTRINVLVNAYRAAAEGTVTGTPDQATFEATLKDQTDANREAGKAAREAKAAEAKAKGTEAVPQGDSEATVTRPATVADAVRILWTLVEQFGEDPKFITAIKDAENFVQAGIAVAA